MQIVRTILWVALLVLLLAFSFFNWRPVEVQIWDNLVLETKIPALVVTSFLLGLIPMWLVHRGSKWRLQRRISTLETSVRANAVTPAAPAASSASPAPAPVPDVAAPAKPAAPDPTKLRAQVDRHHRAALAAFRKQDLRTAIREWDQVLEIDPSNDLARARRQEAIELERRLKEMK